MNKFITEAHVMMGARMAPSTNYDFALPRGFANLLIKPYTGSTITTAVAGVKTAATSGTLGAASSNTGQAAENFYTKLLGYARVASAATAVSHVGTFLWIVKDRIQPTNAVNSYVA